ncbi:hypothetical protein BJ138DRAFT_1115536 [Hygrophoropsis aurantiaca]|uniref:Uncharacterized protein n=1 Tax=Hygrophoropsis aurantiaca TaxID=72124 RepID=A0ACB8A6U1_9AGAM|nr:hypothetical protein BJ138DRAFT_1115536 [Hygrophoropsis aurantiaca]
MQSDTLRLMYWVQGEAPDRILPVKIARTEMIHDLKKAIKVDRTRVFKDIDAADMVLWKVSLTLGDRKFKQKLDDLKLDPGDALSPGRVQLFEIFPVPPPPGQLHIVVQKPPKPLVGKLLFFVATSPYRSAVAVSSAATIRLNCLVRGDTRNHIFSVEIAGTQNVHALRKAIKVEKPHVFSDIEADGLILWNVSIALDNVERALQDNSFGEPLESVLVLQEVFQDPFHNHLHVLAQHPHQQLIAGTNERQNYLRTLAAMPYKPPSERGKPLEFDYFQSTKCRIEWMRPPPKHDTIPVTLLHPIFGQFLDDSRAHEPISEDNNFVRQLLSEMPNFFNNEKERETAFYKILQAYHGGIVPSSLRSGAQTGGATNVIGHRYMILEVKPEIGSGDADPYCQALLHFIEATPDYVGKSGFNFPCIIVTLFGAHMSFSGAVWTGRPACQLLSTALPFFWDPSDTEMSEFAASHIGAFKKALQSLENLYKEFARHPENFSDLQPKFPYPRSYISLETKEQEHFRYIRTLERNKLLFIVQTGESKQLCVKFARRYSAEVHQQYATMGFAPQLRGYEVIPGGWHMDLLDDEYRCLRSIKYSLLKEEKLELKEDLRDKLASFHSQGFVHGDVRNTNVMVNQRQKNMDDCRL